MACVKHENHRIKEELMQQWCRLALLQPQNASNFTRRSHGAMECDTWCFQHHNISQHVTTYHNMSQHYVRTSCCCCQRLNSSWPCADFHSCPSLPGDRRQDTHPRHITAACERIDLLWITMLFLQQAVLVDPRNGFLVRSTQKSSL